MDKQELNELRRYANDMVELHGPTTYAKLHTQSLIELLDYIEELEASLPFFQVLDRVPWKQVDPVNAERTDNAIKKAAAALWGFMKEYAKGSQSPPEIRKWAKDVMDAAKDTS